MLRRLSETLLATLLTAALGVGCGGGDNGAQQGQPGGTGETIEIKPTTVKMLAGNMNDEVFKFMVIDPMAKKYPQITIERLSGGLDKVLSSGEIPDIITDWNGGVPSYKSYDVLMDLTPLLKKHNVDLGRFQDVYIQAIKAASDKGEIFALPYYAQLNALYYNKDIFDKFGVSYPKDGMTWDDALELGKRMTRMDNGIQIQGFNYGQVHRLAFPFSPNIIDPKTLAVNLNNAGWNVVWKRAFEYAKQFDSIPGNSPNRDFNKGEVAMWAALGDSLPDIKKAVQNGMINLGVAQYPQFKEAPNTYGMVDAHYAFIVKTSRNQDAAMKVLEVMTSDEVQLAAAKTYGRLSPLKNPELQKQFGAEFLPGVDMQSIFKSIPAPGTAFHELYPKGRDSVLNEYKLVAQGKEDINTALLNAENNINKIIEEYKSTH